MDIKKRKLCANKLGDRWFFLILIEGVCLSCYEFVQCWVMSIGDAGGPKRGLYQYEGSFFYYILFLKKISITGAELYFAA